MASTRRQLPGAARKPQRKASASGARPALDPELFERFSDAFVALDRDWRYVYVNAKAGELFGRRPEDLLGKHIWTEFPEGVGQPFHGAYERALAEQLTIVLDDYYAPWDRWFENRIYPSPDGLSIFFTEITSRKRAEEALREKAYLLAESQRIARIGSWLWDRTGPITWTDETYRVYGVSPETFTPTVESLVHLLHPEDRPAMQRWIEDCGAGEGPGDIEFRAILRDGTIRLLSGRGELVPATDSSPARMIGTVQDITERKRAELALRANQEQLRSLIEEAPVSIAMFDREMRYLVTSRRWLADDDGGLSDLVGRSHYEVHPDLPERWKEVHRRGLAGESVRNDDDLWIQADGTKKWLRWAVLPWHDARGEIGGIIISTEDITAYKQAGEALRALPGRLLAAQEEERRRIARELHDELGQLLTAAQMNLQSVVRRVGPETSALLAPALATLEGAFASARELAVELRPSLLDDLGLLPALRWQLDRIGRAAELVVHLAADAGSERFAPELETVCFRVAQEALTNIARHAAAREVWVELAQEDGRLVLSVRDDGRGFDLAAAEARAARGDSIGLVGMRERVALVGGTLEIRSLPGSGTEVRATLPVDCTADAAGRPATGGGAAPP